jgi:RNA 2',3'-cyclic 3'-phosphodiesterase
MARLFLAIWPGDAASASLAQLAQDVALVAQGKPVERAKIHLTLVFLGEVARERQEAIAQVARSSARRKRFTLVLDRVGSFRRSRVAWAGASVEPPGLMDLQSRLEGGLRAAGFTPEERPYRPHVTLARKVAQALPMAAIEPVHIACEAIALVLSESGTGRYATLESWALD